MKDQLAAAQARPSLSTDTGSSAPSSVVSPSTSSLSDDNLLNVPTPSDLCLSDLTPGNESPTKESPLYTTPRAVKLPSTPGSTQNPSLHRFSHHLPRSALSTPPSAISSLARSSTVPSLSSTPSRLPPRTPVSRPTPNRNASAASSTGTTGGIPPTATKSKGVQMVSEMRARVRVLEQKIHTRVPRIRMGSITSRTGVNTMPPPPPPKAKPSSVNISPAPSTSSLRSTNYEERTAHVKPRRQSIDLESEQKRTPVADSSGWVLIMEDSPSPIKDKDKERRRTSSPSAPSAFRPLASASHESPSAIPRAPSALSQSAIPTGIHRPQSRLSVSTEGRSSVSTNATSSTISSIPTPSSRPSTPTYLPLPTYGGAGTGLKLSTGPGSGAYSLKRSSLGSSSMRSPALSNPGSHLPAPHSNVTVRPNSKITVPGSMSQSRIGRPAGNASGRRSTGEASGDGTLDTGGKTRDASRARSGSTTALYGRNGL